MAKTTAEQRAELRKRQHQCLQRGITSVVVSIDELDALLADADALEAAEKKRDDLRAHAEAAEAERDKLAARSGLITRASSNWRP